MADYTILLIDYNPRSVDSLKAPLEKAGYRVAVAGDGLSGIRAFHDLKPDLTLVEAMLPKKHGFEVCREIKETEQGRGSPVLILTGVYRGHKYRSQALHQYGCDRYLEKPLSDESLLAAVRSFLPEQMPAAARVTHVEPIDSRVVRPAGPSAAEPAVATTTGGVRPGSAEMEILDQLDNLFSGKGSRGSAPAGQPTPTDRDPEI
jgi:DNA-binding response OmpR family regulator